VVEVGVVVGVVVGVEVGVEVVVNGPHPDKLARLDLEKLICDLDSARFKRRISWRDVAAETGVAASTLTRMAQGKHPDVDNFLCLLEWLKASHATYLEKS